MACLAVRMDKAYMHFLLMQAMLPSQELPGSLSKLWQPLKQTPKPQYLLWSLCVQAEQSRKNQRCGPAQVH